MLEGKSIIVTGGGSGIGEGAAKVVAAYGGLVTIGDLDVVGAQRVAGEIAAAGGTAVACKCDITDPQQVAAMIGTATDAFGGLYGAFNNAGIPGRFIATLDMERGDWDSVLGVDLVGTWDCIRQEIAAIRHSGLPGAIVNNASNAGYTGVPTMAAYAAAKAGVINLTKTIAVEHGREGLRCNAICPGTIETPPVHANKARGIDFKMEEKAPLGRMGTPAEAGELVAWLLSDRSSYITGQAISIDGGTSACF